jgi:hypothetical protein
MKSHFLIIFVLIVVILLSLGTFIIPNGTAAPPLLPTRPEDIPKQEGKDDSEDDQPVGAYIELHAPHAPAGAWAVVQWQNELGDWYDVEGWRGTLNEHRRRRWWVDQKDFGTGPFRWIVQQPSGGPILAVSPSFDLPNAAGQLKQIDLSPNTE